MLVWPLSILASLLPLALADVKFTIPAPGAQVAEGLISVAWEEGSGQTTLAQLAGYTLYLVAGGATDATTVRDDCKAFIWLGCSLFN